MAYCNHCEEDCKTTCNRDTGHVCCAGCGRILVQEIYSDAPNFFPDKGGNKKSDSVRTDWGVYSDSRLKTIERGREEIQGLVTQLQMGGGQTTIAEATRLYEIAVDKNFTRGRRISQVAAACLYINCRYNKRPYLLIDFSDQLMISVYVLGAVFLQLCKLLNLADHPIYQKPIDPSLFIHRFTDRLLGRSNEPVSRTALHIVASMKRDWMQTGRKPSGLCGAALYISVLSHGLNYSKSDIVKVVYICEATLTKRLIEFENTESGSLTVDEFLTRADESEQYVPNQLPRPGEVLCEHKGETHFAHGLCKSCFDELEEISGGLQGGTEPPAFQRAERQRMEVEKAQEKIRDSNTDDMEAGFSNNGSGSTSYKSLASGVPKNTGDQATDTPTLNEALELENAVDNDPESLSDIDDVEVDGYIHNEEEKRFKQIIWEEMNKEYLEEQAAKEAAAAAAKKAHEASLKNLSADQILAQELEATAAEALAKSKKERRQKRAAEKSKNSAPADTPSEATREMLKRKTFSSRVNYRVLDSLYESDQEKVKKQRPESGTGDANGKLDTIEENDNAFGMGAMDYDNETFDNNFLGGGDDDFDEIRNVPRNYADLEFEE